MPGYGIPETKKGLLPWSWAKERLEKSHNYWITTVRPDGTPHTMVVWGLWLDGAFYFSTGSQSRKARNLKENPRCNICTEQAHEAVVVEGKAKLVRDRDVLRRFFRRYEKKYDWDMSEMQEEPIFSVTPRLAFGLYEKKYMETATKWVFGVGPQ
jgi:PPOX class probable F420-dependent enzyme